MSGVKETDAPLRRGAVLFVHRPGCEKHPQTRRLLRGTRGGAAVQVLNSSHRPMCSWKGASGTSFDSTRLTYVDYLQNGFFLHLPSFKRFQLDACRYIAGNFVVSPIVYAVVFQFYRREVLAGLFYSYHDLRAFTLVCFKPAVHHR